MNRRGAPRRISSTSHQRDAPAGEWSHRSRGRGRGRDYAPHRDFKDHGGPQQQQQQQQQQQEEAVPRGSCQIMCPSRELRQRESQNRLHHFEMLAGTEMNRVPAADPSRAVKEYSRPAAGKDATNPADLRPPAVLLKTVSYLINEIATWSHLHPWTEVYAFVFDRLRSVKQDMIIQRMRGPDCIGILERTVRFHIFASYQLCGEPLRFFDPCINDRHLQEYLSWLLECYSSEPGPHPNQEELHALDLLYNLGSIRAMRHALQLPIQTRCTPAITLALSINRAYLERNPVRLLRLAQKLNFLQSCALHRHLVSCRRDLLQVYSHGHSIRNCRFPLDRLSQLLALDAPLTMSLCRLYGMEVNKDNQVVFSKTTFTEPEQGKLHCTLYHGIVAEKQKDLAIGSIIHGCA